MLASSKSFKGHSGKLLWSLTSGLAILVYCSKNNKDSPISCNSHAVMQEHQCDTCGIPCKSFSLHGVRAHLFPCPGLRPCSPPESTCACAYCWCIWTQVRGSRPGWVGGWVRFPCVLLLLKLHPSWSNSALPLPPSPSCSTQPCPVPPIPRLPPTLCTNLPVAVSACCPYPYCCSTNLPY